MKKHLIMAGVLGLTAAAAQAQSSVTLYGAIDAGLVYVNNAGGNPLWVQSSGAVSDSYFGLRGSEDLGNGLRAVFKLEGAFGVNNGGVGGDGTLFNREAYVGLESKDFGSVTLGRQYGAVQDYLAPLSLADSVNVAGHPFDNDNLNGSTSFRNSVKYTSADYAGFRFGGLYGFSNSTDFTANRAWSIGASYEKGPFTVGAAYQQEGWNSTNAAGSWSDGGFPAELVRTYGVGAGYAFGPGKVRFVWTHTQANNLAFSSPVPGKNVRVDNYELNGTWALTPALAALGSYTFTDGRVSTDGSSAKPQWQTAVLALDYSLSKRTDFYVAGVYQHASGSYGDEVVGGNLVTVTNVAQINVLPASSSRNQVAAAVGLRHRF